MNIKSSGFLSLMIATLIPLEISVANSNNFPLKVSLQFPTTVNRGAPRATSGAGTRGKSCLLDNENLIALIPNQQEVITISPNPTFFIYLPKSQAQHGDFVLVDAKGKDIYLSNVKLPNQTSIIPISIPKNISLQIGQEYQWQFSINCKIEEQEVSNYVKAKIKRIDLNSPLKTKLNQAKTDLEKAEVYAQANIWQDTLMIAAQLRNSNKNEWQEFLTSVGLEKLNSVPFSDVLLTTPN